MTVHAGRRWFFFVRPSDAVDQALLDRISSLLRRDLKLGPSAAISEQTVLIGGDMDMDSIDILLVLTSLEKEFGVQLTSDKVSKSAFQTVGTLVAFVEQTREHARPVEAPASSVRSGVEWLTALPHGPSFRFVSEVRSIDPGRRADGIWRVMGDEFFLTGHFPGRPIVPGVLISEVLTGHFPGRPIVPGVLISEALAQLAGLTAASGADAARNLAGNQRGGHLAHVDVRFMHAVKPPAQIALRTVVRNTLGGLHQYDVAAEVEGICVASGTVTIHLHGPELSHESQARSTV